MIAAPDFPNIDWANEDVGRLAEIFSEKFDVMVQKKDETIDRLVEENRQLKQEIAHLKAGGGAEPGVTMPSSSRTIRVQKGTQRGAGLPTPASTSA